MPLAYRLCGTLTLETRDIDEIHIEYPQLPNNIMATKAVQGRQPPAKQNPNQT
jgi:hypothetical protein